MTGQNVGSTPLAITIVPCQQSSPCIRFQWAQTGKKCPGPGTPPALDKAPLGVGKEKTWVAPINDGLMYLWESKRPLSNSVFHEEGRSVNKIPEAGLWLLSVKREKEKNHQTQKPTLSWSIHLNTLKSKTKLKSLLGMIVS